MQAMILAAGFGSRLRPYSLVRPKPLFPILNIPLLLLTVKRLRNSGFSRIIVNCHHLREHVVAALDAVPDVIVQEEEEILGTGGGLRKALACLDDEPLLVTNGDIYHQLDFKAIFSLHSGSDTPVTMVLHDCPRFNNVAVSATDIVGFSRSSGRSGSLAYTGVQVVEPEILSGLPPGQNSCIIDYYRSLLSRGKRLSYSLAAGSDWTDMGTPRDYLELHAGLLSGTRFLWREFGFSVRTPFQVSEKAELPGSARLLDWACVGNARIGKRAEIRRSIVWDGAVVPDDAVLVDAIVVP